MESLLNYMPLTPQKDDSLDSIVSSDDDFKLDDFQEEKPDLYEHIGAPIPLPKERNGYNSDVRTAYNFNFSKLPEEMYNAPSSKEEIINPKTTKTMPSVPKVQRNNSIKAGIENEDESDDDSQTLFQLYPKQDERLVYWKYPNQGDWEMRTKIYASYLIHIEKLLKNKDVRVQYKRENNVRDDPIIPTRDNALHFDSMFESGNLFAAYKISDSEYDLILQNDINTKGHTQWFFFAVSNTKRNQTIKFNIINLLKSDSLFNDGMKPVVFSTFENETRGDGWKRTAFDISYYKNNIIREGVIGKTYYTLTFTYNFKNDEDTVYFAHCYPYTYSDLKGYLTKLCEDEKRKTYVVRRTLCETLAQNECEYLSITSPSSLENITQRHGIVITSRQHPGETLSSYIMEGVINFLTGEDPEAQYLRKRCVFKVVPMLNPDGVIHGNYRTSLCGKDLNRVWNKPHSRLHPTIFHTQEMIRRMQRGRKLEFYCDLHGHSRKKNAFFYGNAPPHNIYKPRVFPLIVSNLSKYTTFKDCQFAIQKSKESTARIALWKEFSIDNIFTLEASFYGYNDQNKIVHFTKEDYRNLGVDLGKSIFIYVKQMLQDNLPIPGALEAKLSAAVNEKNQPKQSVKEKDGTTATTAATVNPSSDIRRRSASVSNNLKKGNLNTNPNNNNSPILQPSNDLFANIDCKDLMKQLKQNKEMIAMGNKGDDSGSDTGLSEDDIPLKELRKVLPIPRKKKKKNPDLVKKKSNISASLKKEEKSPVPEKLPRAQSTASMIPASSFQLQSPNEKLKQNRSYKKSFKMQNELFGGGSRERVLSEDDEATINNLMQTDKNLSALFYDFDASIQQIYKPLPINTGPLGKSFTYQKIVPKPSLAQAKLFEDGKLFVLGAKAGIETVSTTIDLNSKLGGKNQVSRSILAKIKSKFLDKELNRGHLKHLEKKLTSELARKPLDPMVEIPEKDIDTNSPSMIDDDSSYLKSKQYSSSIQFSPMKKGMSSYFQDKFSLDEPDQKLEAVKLNLFFENKLNTNDPNNNINVQSLEKNQITSLKSIGNRGGDEVIRSHNSASVILKQPKRLAFKEKEVSSTTTLPQIMSVNSGRVEAKEVFINESSSLNTFKMPGSEELQKIAFFKIKPPKINHRTVILDSGLPSERDLQDKEKLNRRRERISMDPIKYESKTNQSLKQYQSFSSKDPSLSPQKHRLIKLDKDIKGDLERRGVETDFYNLKKLRKNQSGTNLKKL